MTLTRPKVSAVINSYNGEGWLAEAIDSVLAQTFGDFELLVIDDCSTDKTADIVRSFDDPRLRFIELDNHVSVAAARANAIEQTCGEWIAFLDQDDTWHPQKLEWQLARAQAAPGCVMVYGRTQRFGHTSLRTNFDPWYVRSDLPEGDIFAQILAHPSFIAMSSLMVRRDVALGLLPMPDHVCLCPDYYIAVECASRGQVAAVQAICCRYRVHEQSMSFLNAAAIHLEAATIIERAARPGDRRTARRRQQVGSSLAAAAEIQSGDWVQGVRRLLRDGSIMFLAARPLVHIYRNLQILVRGQR